MAEPFLTELPPRTESLLKVVAQAFNEDESPVSVAVSSMEAPSAVRAAHVLAPRLSIEFLTKPTPDPREPFEPVQVRLWTYEGHDATPALPEPPRELLDQMAPILGEEFSLDVWGERASELARSLGHLSPCQILGAMLHPPPTPEEHWPWEWMFRSQILAALVLARAERDDWLASAEAAHLLDVARGPVDWTTTAALVGLIDRARQDPRTSTAIVKNVLRWSERPMSPIWYMCAYDPMWRLLALVSSLEPRTRALVARRIKELDSDEMDG